jgi:MFS family permease
MTVTNTGNILCDKTKLPLDTKELLAKEQALQMKYYMGIFSACAILASLFTGSWSDCIGRKPSMILPSLLGIPAEILFAGEQFVTCCLWCLD